MLANVNILSGAWISLAFILGPEGVKEGKRINHVDFLGQRMVEFDTGLVLTIWTGSAPVLVVVLGYWLSKRIEAKKLVRRRKGKVYRRFLWAIREAVQALDDLRTLQLLKIKSPRDDEDVASNSFKLMSLQSIWTNPDAMETLRTVVMEGYEEEEPKPKQVVENFESLKTLFNMELAHILQVNLKRVGKYAEELEMFSLPPSLKASLNKVFQLLSQKQSAVVAGSLLELAGLRGIDTGKDVDQSINAWNEALGELRKELDKDLKSAF